MNSKKQIMVFAMGAAALITLATTLIVAAHYWEMLAGIWLIAIVGLLLPDWVTWWSTYWYAKADQDRAVKITTMLVAAAMTVTMVLNAGAVLSVWWDSKERVAYESREATGRNLAASNRSSEVQRMKAAGVSQRNIDTFLKEEAGRDKVLAGDTRPVYQSQVPEPVRRYMAFWVYLVPFLVGLVGKFLVVAAIALPGGVEFGQPTREWVPNELEANGRPK